MLPVLPNKHRYIHKDPAHFLFQLIHYSALPYTSTMNPILTSMIWSLIQSSTSTGNTLW